MKDVNIVVVDDSPTFVKMLTRLLENEGFHVAGYAYSKDEAIETVKRLNPDIVTMDMIMPGTDGIECTKAIHAINPKINVIVVSSLWDDESIRQAHIAKASGYIHKPVDPAELTFWINRVTEENEIFSELEAVYFSAFEEALTNNMKKNFNYVPRFLDRDTADIVHESRSVCIVVGLTGRYKGRIFCDLSSETARRITSVILNRETHSKEEIICTLSKYVSEGMVVACAALNQKNKLLNIHSAPPIIFYGESILIAKSNLDTVTSEIAETVFGDIYINVGFIKDIRP